MKTQKIIYYSDELNDEFAGDNITAKKIDKDYDYHGGIWRKIGRVLLYRVFAVPVGWVMLKIKYAHKIYGREKLKGYRRFFLYGNHTNNLADPFIPSMISAPQGTYVIVHPNNVSMPVLGKLTPCLGALPLPGDMESTRNFIKEIECRYSEGSTITIYPEAHIWPYYTKIRPFKDMSFRYPVQLSAPVFCFTNCYKKRKFLKSPKMVTYIDGPFISDGTKPAKEQKAWLREQVYNAMVARSDENDIEVVKYIRRETDD
jgi:1-acyl-sn-glycerol-3-phosphate acyltransferase